MEHDFWLERWQQQQIGFHLPTVNPRLVQHASLLPSVAGQRVLVPLCGKTIDMAWLAERGLQVLGVELSPVAVNAFFVDRGWTPTVTQDGPFARYAANGVEILCGDFFALDQKRAGDLHGLYDRAAVVALPNEMRRAYAAHLATLLPPGARGLLVTFDYPQEEMQGPPFSVPESNVRDLFEPAFAVDRVASYDILQDEPRMRERGLTQLHEHVYSLTRRL